MAVLLAIGAALVGFAGAQSAKPMAEAPRLAIGLPTDGGTLCRQDSDCPQGTFCYRPGDDLIGGCVPARAGRDASGGPTGAEE